MAVRLSIVQVLEIKRRLSTGERHSAIAADFGVTRSLIGQIGSGRTWSRVGFVDHAARRVNCAQCKAAFTRKSSTQRFCSDQCKDRWNGTRREVPTDPTKRQYWNYKSKMLRRFGLTLADFDRLLAMQGGVCAICRQASQAGRWRRFAVDHDHTTGEVRGLLCRACNTGLGFFADAVKRLMQAIQYLSASEERRAAV